MQNVPSCIFDTYPTLIAFAIKIVFQAKKRFKKTDFYLLVLSIISKTRKTKKKQMTNSICLSLIYNICLQEGVGVRITQQQNDRCVTLTQRQNDMVRHFDTATK